MIPILILIRQAGAHVRYDTRGRGATFPSKALRAGKTLRSKANHGKVVLSERKRAMERFCQMTLRTQVSRGTPAENTVCSKSSYEPTLS